MTSINPNLPHLTQVSNSIGTAEHYNLSYATTALTPPFGADSAYSGATATRLALVGVPTGGNGYYTMTYDSGTGGASAGELLKVRFPWGGTLGWSYSTANYAGSRALREVSNRYLAADSGGTTVWTYPITHSDSGGSIASVHADTTLADASGVGAKKWVFNTSGAAWQIGLASDFIRKRTTNPCS